MFTRKLAVEYRTREATFAPWDELGYDREEVKRALAMLLRAFRWSLDDGLRLRPEDRVWDFYWSYYPTCNPRGPRWRRWIGSMPELEMETLGRDLRKAVPANTIFDLHQSITVREVVELMKSRDSRTQR
jgi:hypothetical protein